MGKREMARPDGFFSEEEEGKAEDPDDCMTDEDMSDGPGGPGEGAAPDDSAVQRAKFLKIMRDRFVNGDEPGYDYAKIDADSDLDDVAELGRDAEERYFDDGDGSDDDEL